jgi:hypothetical protein
MSLFTEAHLMLTPAWANFFAAEVSAAATLTGLIVVAISINLGRILAFEHLPGRAAESLVILTSALVLASLWLMPGQSNLALGIEALIVGGIPLSGVALVQMKSRKVTQLTQLRKVIRVVMNTTTSVLFIAAGVLVLSGINAGFYSAAVGVIAALIAGVWNAWILLVEILR